MIIKKYYRDRMLKEKVNYILFDLMKKNNINFFSVSEIIISKRSDSMKVYISFFKDEEKENILFFLNTKIYYIKKILAESHIFSFIPWIRFYEQKNLL